MDSFKFYNQALVSKAHNKAHWFKSKALISKGNGITQGGLSEREREREE